MRNRIMPLALAGALSLSVLGGSALAYSGLENFQKSEVYVPGHFTDVAEGSWYAVNVQTAYELGLMNGSGPNTFAPDGNITLAESVTLACRLHSIYHGSGAAFTAAPGQKWYQPYVDYALAQQILAPGVYSEYDVQASRAQFASILAAALPAEALSVRNQVTLDNIPDVTAQMPYAQAVLLLYRAGVLTGSDEQGSFRPGAPITRAEVSAIVTRMASAELRKSMEVPGGGEADGTRLKPFSGKDGVTLTYYSGRNNPTCQISITCTGQLGGDAANRLAAAEQNSAAPQGKEWRFYEFQVSYLSSSDGSDYQIEYFISDGYFQPDGSEVKGSIATLHSPHNLPDSRFSLYPGGTCRFVRAIQVPEGQQELLLRIPRDGRNQYTWVKLDAETSGTIIPEEWQMAFDPQRSGTLENPLACDNDTPVFYQPSYLDAAEISLQCTGMLDGKDADELVHEEYYGSADPASDEEWRFYEFELSSLSGEKPITSNLINEKTFFTADGRQLPVTERAYLLKQLDGYDPLDVKLAPGESHTVIYGILVKKNVGDLLLRIPIARGTDYAWLRLDPDGTGSVLSEFAGGSGSQEKPEPVPDDKPGTETELSCPYPVFDSFSGVPSLDYFTSGQEGTMTSCKTYGNTMGSMTLLYSGLSAAQVQTYRDALTECGYRVMTVGPAGHSQVLVYELNTIGEQNYREVRLFPVEMDDGSYTVTLIVSQLRPSNQW